MIPKCAAALCGLVFATFVALPVAGANTGFDLYSGEVAVDSQSAAEREQLVPEAFIRVLQKLSGQREIPNSPALEAALADANRLMVSFNYSSDTRLNTSGEEEQQLKLVAQFLPSAVDEVIAGIGLPRWSAERPPVEIWVVIDNDGDRRLKPLEYEYAWGAMERIAALRGLPVGWPELDEEEIQLIDMRLVWGGFTDYLVERGAPGDGVVIVAVRREGTQWVLRWNLASSGQHWSWRNSDRELMYALAEGIHEMVDQIAASNSIAATEQGVWTMDVTIGDLDGADDYTACLGYLQAQSLVTAVEVLGAEPGRVYFRLQTNAAPEHLIEQFDRGSALLPVGTGQEAYYRFLY